MSIRVPIGGTVSVPIGGTLRYTKLPASVLHDARLSPVSRLVYAELALWTFQGRTCSIGVRKIAKNLGFAVSTVTEAISALATAGVVEKNPPLKRGGRMIYILASPVFGQKQGKETVVVSTPRSRRMVSVAG